MFDFKGRYRALDWVCSRDSDDEGNIFWTTIHIRKRWRKTELVFTIREWQTPDEVRKFLSENYEFLMRAFKNGV